MTTLLSFTEGNAPRYPAPGFMLLLIALANVGTWAAFAGTWQTSSALDSFLTILRLGLVDQRSYPLFAMLFGFGLAIMVQRQRAHSLKYARRRVDAMSRRSRPEYLLAVASEKARNLLHRRAWWMLLVGLPHGLIFPGDVIGSYALVALLFAGPARGGADVRGARWVLSAVGRRSMTAYLSQSLFFLLLFSVVSAAELPVSESMNVLIACLGWVLIATGCVALEKVGKRGPFEVLLRRAVAQTRTVEPRPVIADVAFLTAT